MTWSNDPGLRAFDWASVHV